MLKIKSYKLGNHNSNLNIMVYRVFKNFMILSCVEEPKNKNKNKNKIYPMMSIPLMTHLLIKVLVVLNWSKEILTLNPKTILRRESYRMMMMILILNIIRRQKNKSASIIKSKPIPKYKRMKLNKFSNRNNKNRMWNIKENSEIGKSYHCEHKIKIFILFYTNNLLLLSIIINLTN